VVADRAAGLAQRREPGMEERAMRPDTIFDPTPASAGWSPPASPSAPRPIEPASHEVLAGIIELGPT
jgi:hypothetical protein